MADADPILSEPERASWPFRSPTASFLTLVAFTGLLLFVRLDYPLLEPDESRFAEIPRLMLQHESLLPVLRAQPYHDKPPFGYWLVAGSYCLFGVQESAVRLVPALASWLSILAVYQWCCHTLGGRTAFLSGLVLCTTLGFLALGRMMLIDSLLTLWVLLALGTGQLALFDSRLRARWWMASAVACGLGMLTKGPLALALVLPPLAVYPWVDRDAIRPRWRHWLAYLGAATLVAAPCYLWIMWRSPTFAEEFFWFHNFKRFFLPTEVSLHPAPWWYYGPVLLLLLLPWSPLLLALGVARALSFRWPSSTSSPVPRVQGNEENSAVRWCLLVAGWMVLFLSVSRGKLAPYLMPVLPFLAVVIGCGLEGMLARWQRAEPPAGLDRLVLQWLPIAGTVVPLLAVAVVALWEVGDAVGSAALVTLAVSGLAALGLWPSARRPWGAWVCCFAASGLLAACCCWHLLPAVAERRSEGLAAMRLIQSAVDQETRVVAYGGNRDATSFYRQRDELRVYLPSHADELRTLLADGTPTLILAKRSRLQELLEVLGSACVVKDVRLDATRAAVLVVGDSDPVEAQSPRPAIGH